VLVAVFFEGGILYCQGLAKSMMATFRASGTSLFVVGLAWVVLADSAAAQSRSRIRSRDGDQVIAHNERPVPQVFTATRWEVTSGSTPGAMVTLSCGPFENKNEPGNFVDGQLGLRLRSSQGHADWAVSVAADRTNVSGGNKVANVVAISRDRGSGSLELTVSFLGADVVELVEGDYSTTVTGTITAR